MAFSWIIPSILLLLTVVASSNVAKFSVDEGEKSGTFVGNVATESGFLQNLPETDKHNVVFVFGATSPDYSYLFTMDKKTGKIETAKSLDRETLCGSRNPCALSLKVNVHAGSVFEIVKVTIVVNDVNDNEPIFNPSQTVVNIPESSGVGDAFQLPIATDKDVDKNAQISYTITTGNQMDTFELRSPTVDNNQLFLVLKKDVDREKVDIYTLNIEAVDGGSSPKRAVLVVTVHITDVNDQPPTFTQPSYNATLSEGSTKGNPILTVSATDSDTGQGGSVVYSLGTSTEFDVASTFSIDPKTGVITAKINLDYEVAKSYRFTVIAHDSGPQPLSSSATINVVIRDMNDNIPAITLTTSNPNGVVEILETAKKGSFVVHISVFDADSGKNGLVECSIDSNLFKLVRVEDKDFKVLLNTDLNRERTKSYRIKMTCSDKGTTQMIGIKDITINILDVNDNKPKFKQSEYRTFVTENNSPGKSILTVLADDLDSGLNGKISYSLSFDAQKYFTINRDTGEISAKISLDREITDEIQFTVTASDNGSPVYTDAATVIVTILDENDNSPKFDRRKYIFNVTEEQASNIVIGTVNANDSDKDGAGQVSYSIVPGRQSSKFGISLHDGVIRTRTTFDREAQKSYTFEVIAEDKGTPSRQSTATVVVIVNDINDNKPVIRFPNNGSIKIMDTFPVDGVLLKMNSYDLDEGRNAIIRYSIKNTTFGKMFYVDQSGEIRLSSSLRKHSFIGTQTITITAEDNGLHPLKSEAVLSVVVGKDGNAKFDTPETGANTQTNLIIIVVIVSISTLISISLIGAIYIIHSRQKLEKLKMDATPEAPPDKLDNVIGSYSEQSYSSEASTTSTDCENNMKEIPQRQHDPQHQHYNDQHNQHHHQHQSSANVDRLYPHCTSPNFVISGNVSKQPKHEIHVPSQYVNNTTTSSPRSAAVSDSRWTNHDTSSLPGSSSDVISYDDTMDLRRSMRNNTQKQLISDLSRKTTPYSQYIQMDSGSLLT